MKEKKLLQDNLEKQKAIFKEWDEKYKLLCKTHGIEERKIEDKVHGNLLKRTNEKEENENQEEVNLVPVVEKQVSKRNEIVKRVLYEDVMNFGYELNMTLKIKRIEYYTVEKTLFPEKLKKKEGTQISLKDVIEALKK